MLRILSRAFVKAFTTGVAVGIAYFFVMALMGRPLNAADLGVEAILFGVVVMATMMFPFTFFEMENNVERD